MSGIHLKLATLEKKIDATMSLLQKVDPATETKLTAQTPTNEVQSLHYDFRPEAEMLGLILFIASTYVIAVTIALFTFNPNAHGDDTLDSD